MTDYQTYVKIHKHYAYKGNDYNDVIQLVICAKDIILSISQTYTPAMIIHTAVRHIGTLERLIEQQIPMPIQIERSVACIACHHCVYCIVECLVLQLESTEIKQMISRRMDNKRASIVNQCTVGIGRWLGISYNV